MKEILGQALGTSQSVLELSKALGKVKETKEAKEQKEREFEQREQQHREEMSFKKEQAETKEAEKLADLEAKAKEKKKEEKQKRAEYKESLGQSIVSENATREQMKIYKNRRALGFSHEDALKMSKIKMTDEQKQRYAQSRRLISIDKANRGGTKL